MTRSQASERIRAQAIIDRLSETYPDATCTLDHQSPWELLVGAILASQCTDERVNKVTPELFRRYPTMEAMAAASQEDLEPIIYSCGFFRSKAKALHGSANMLIDDFGGEIPHTVDELLKLPGVGRKIANLIVGDAFGGRAVVVDTHCGRISRLLGFTESESPARIERDLMEVVPEASWTVWGHLMVAHGRAICRARCRDCFACPVRDLCRYGRSLADDAGTEGDCV
ncbi:MAG: endonuclease III [Saccharofermentanales bacterium]|jgi:endonuclease-3